jgi:glutaminyl-peptide cyclotransferase
MNRAVSVRVVVAALVGQIVVLGAVILVVVNGFPAIGGGDEDSTSAGPRREEATPAAAPPPAARSNIDRFDASRAMREARYQVGLGPRPAGSAASRRLAEHLRARLPRGRFEALGPAHPGLRNVVGTLRGRRPAVVFAAHYDTKDIPGFVGAEDGASGSAVLLELARVIRRSARPARARELRFVFFDGEENPDDDKDFYATALRGSKAYLAAHRSEVGALVLLDFVGQRDLSLPREAGSDPALWARLRSAARRVGTLSVFPADRVVGEILDDHTPFARAGIPAIDLIDFDYPHFHTTRDTLDKLSVRSLDAVGETVVELALRMRRG